MDDYSSELPGKLLSDLRRAAYTVKGAESVTVVTHIDADGITAGVIAAETLRRLGIRHTLRFERKITEETVADINACTDDLVWICDLGSAYMGQFVRSGLVVTDHHVPDPKWRSGQSMLEAFGTVHQLNPHMYRVSGSYEVSGAGMTYLLSKTISPDNTDLAYLAVIGAIGDFQDTRESQLVGWNRIILDDAVKAGDITVSNGIRYFGRGTRPILQFLQYGEPVVDGLTGNVDACMGLLQMYDIPMYGPDGKKRTWMDLTDVERAILTDELMTRTVREEDRKALFGELYSVTRYDPRSCLGDAKEFATTLNSCGRYDDAETGARICEGDMSALEDAESNRKDHRKNISLALAYVKENKLLRRLNHIQYFEAGSAIRETVVGIVAGMILSSSDAVPDMPILAFAEADDGVKVSARAPRSLIDRGLDLSRIMSSAAESVGGMGGGHNVAAGATIPEGKEKVFLEKVDELVAASLSP